MKIKFYNQILVAITFTIVLASCSNDDDTSTVVDNAQQISQIENTAASGTWRITNFNDSGQDETSDFASYNFTFNADGSLVASNGSNTITGTWSITNDSNSSSSSSDNDIDFNIFFPVPESNDFEDLNDDWDIVSTTATKIELIDVSGGNGGTDILEFQKN